MTMKMTILRALGKSVFLYDVVSVALAGMALALALVGMALALVGMALASAETAWVVGMVAEMALAAEMVVEMVVEMATWERFQVEA